MKHLDYTAPGEGEAGERTWQVVRAAFEERLPSPQKRDWRPFALAAAMAVVLAAAFSPPGNAVLGSLRDAVRGAKNAKPALASLPAPGRLLAESSSGIGSCRTTGPNGCSPATGMRRGRRTVSTLAAVHGNELRALEPNGRVHGRSGARAGVRTRRWSFDGFRIAYFAGRSLESSTATAPGDRLLTREFDPDPPRGSRTRTPSRTSTEPGTSRSRTSTNGTATRPCRPARRHVTLLGRRREDIRRRRAACPSKSSRSVARGSARLDRGIAQVSAAAISPNGKRIAFVETRGGRSTLQLTGVLGGQTVPIFGGAGTFANVDWSPDGRRPLLDWSSADQWLFIDSPVKKVLAVSNIRANFGADSRIAGLVLSVTACYGRVRSRRQGGRRNDD